MNFRRWLFVGSALCVIAGVATLTLALCCIFDVIGGQCELWLLGPFVALPLGAGFGLIGRAAGRPADGKESRFPPTRE